MTKFIAGGIFWVHNKYHDTILESNDLIKPTQTQAPFLQSAKMLQWRLLFTFALFWQLTSKGFVILAGAFSGKSLKEFVYKLTVKNCIVVLLMCPKGSGWQGL